MQILEEEGKTSKNKLRIILASASSRRELILRNLRIDFETVVPSGVVEKVFKNPCKTVIFNSSIKAQFVYNRVIISNSNLSGIVIAGFDTIIFLRGEYFGKPENTVQAGLFLKKLSGKKHIAITGVTLIDAASSSTVCGYEVTKVEFEKLSEDMIKQYLEKEDVCDKAGAYDISGFGSILIKRISGCFYNVAGLPVQKFVCLLDKLGYKKQLFKS